MRNPLDNLATILPPPSVPIAAAGDWSDVAKALGTPLPDDYMAFIARYGTGRISGFLWVLNPFEENVHLSFLAQYPRIVAADREIREEFTEELPEPLYPEPGGLLPWGLTDNGDRLYWQTTGHADSWTIVARESRGPESASYPLSMTGLLFAWLSAEIEVPVFPEHRWEPIYEQNPSYDD